MVRKRSSVRFRQRAPLGRLASPEQGRSERVRADLSDPIRPDTTDPILPDTRPSPVVDEAESRPSDERKCGQTPRVIGVVSSGFCTSLRRRVP